MVHGNIYGTSFSSVEDVIHKNRICILDIDVQGVQNILKKVADATTILILPPSIEELSRRLHKRNTENEETIQLRLKNSIAEMEKSSHIPFTKVIVNKDINDSYQELKQSISHFLDSFVSCSPFKIYLHIVNLVERHLWRWNTLSSSFSSFLTFETLPMIFPSNSEKHGIGRGFYQNHLSIPTFTLVMMQMMNCSGVKPQGSSQKWTAHQVEC